jgi:phosphatidylserine/phosphatidylglycerophosphate/cardiolipin synthase-like enzyme
MDDANESESAMNIAEASGDVPLALLNLEIASTAGDRADWLIDNAETYGRLLESLRGARRSVHIAQLAFDADCAAYSGGSLATSASDDAVIAEILIGLAKDEGREIRILLNASWILNTARPLRKFFAKRGVSPRRIEVRGLNRFPHFMHAKLVLIDSREAFLLGSPFVNSYWDDGAHLPFDARRPLRELGGRPLHDVSVHLRGPAVAELEALFAAVWRSSEATAHGTPTVAAPCAAPRVTAPSAGMRVVCDAPDGILAGAPNGGKQMLGELLAGIARARRFIYVEHQYLTSRPIVAALVGALRREPGLEIIIVLNQNPDLTAYRCWQNERLEEHALLRHPRVGVFTLWSTDEDPEREGVTRINQLFIHSKVIVIDDEWAAVGTSNLDGVSMGDFGDDFAGPLGRRVFRGVRNVEVNVVIEAGSHEGLNLEDDSCESHAESIVGLRERLWREHLGADKELSERAERGSLAIWRKAARENVRILASLGVERSSSPAFGQPTRMVGHLLPYSDCAFPGGQLADVGVPLDPKRLVLCYNPTWFGVFASLHWVRNIF